MRAVTPVERAVATYCADWPTAPIDRSGVARVNAETLSDSTPPEFRFRYIDISSVTKGTIDWSSVPCLRFADAPSRARRVLRAGDTMICTVRPLLMAHAFMGLSEEEVTVCSTGFAVVRSDDGLAPSFLRHLPFAEQVTRQLIAWQCGTNYPSVNEWDIRRLAMPIPSPDEQVAIGRILDAVDRALERTRAAVDRALEFDHSLLHEVLEKGLAPNGRSKHGRPRHWTIRRVDELADVGSGVTLGKDVSGFESVQLPYLRVANVQDGYLDLSTIKTVRVRADEIDKFRLAVGDVLMTEGGDIDKLGRGAIWEGQIPQCLHQNHIFRIRPKRDLLEPAFYALVVESDVAKRYFNRVAKRTTNLASTNKTQVRAFRFPAPPTVDEQRQIVAVMKASKATIAALTSQEGALRVLKRSLLHDLLTGRVRVRDTSTVVAS